VTDILRNLAIPRMPIPSTNNDLIDSFIVVRQAWLRYVSS
jgi:hypothetical protein